MDRASAHDDTNAALHFNVRADVDEVANRSAMPIGPVRLFIFKDRSAADTLKRLAKGDTLGSHVAAIQYLNRDTFYAHLARKDWPKHDRVDRPIQRKYFRAPDGRRLKVNPFELDKPKTPALPKASRLRSEVPALYSALSFTMWRYGFVTNTHLTVLWKSLGITDHHEAAKLLSRYNHEAAKWLRVGDGDGIDRCRRSRRAVAVSSNHVFVYVHEVAVERGFHTHELMHVPVRRAKAFAEWSKTCLARLTKCANPHEDAIRFTPCSRKRKIYHPYEGGREEFAVNRQWRWFRYITKNLDPEFQVRSPVDRAWHTARDVFQMKQPFIASGPVRCRKLAGYSENIGPSAQRRAGFESTFALGGWDHLYDGAELDECRAYMVKVAEHEQLQKDRAELDSVLDGLII